MSNKSKKTISVQSFISWGAAIVILALGAKILHYPWAEWLIIIGFAVEFILFIVLGFTAQNDTQTVISNGQSHFDPELFKKLQQTLETINLNTEINSKVVTALVNEIGIQNITNSLSKANDITTIDIKELQTKILQTGENFNTLNSVIEDLSKQYIKQVNAFKSN